MKIIKKEVVEKPFKDLHIGEVFKDKDGDIMMVIYPASSGENVVSLKDGTSYEYSEKEHPAYYNSVVTVYPNAALMLNEEEE